eukprot:2316739-Rhodomonas_salina.6
MPVVACQLRICYAMSGTEGQNRKQIMETAGLTGQVSWREIKHEQPRSWYKEYIGFCLWDLISQSLLLAVCDVLITCAPHCQECDPTGCVQVSYPLREIKCKQPQSPYKVCGDGGCCHLISRSVRCEILTGAGSQIGLAIPVYTLLGLDSITIDPKYAAKSNARNCLFVTGASTNTIAGRAATAAAMHP